MTATLEQLESDPMILRRALDLGETVQIVRDGKIAGSFTPFARASTNTSDGGKPLWDVAELRAWRQRTWGDRVFTDAEECEMRNAENGAAEP